MSDLAAIFEATARDAGDRTALIAPEGQISFADLNTRATGLTERLAAKGITKGDRVLVATPVGIALYATLAALWRLGAVAVFPEPAMGLKGLLHAIRSARPRAFIAAGPYRLLTLLPQLWRIPMICPRADDHGTSARIPLSPGDPALISFTSGSTGLPKAIQRSHAFLLAQNDAVLPLLGTDPAPRDLVAFPVFALINLAVGRTSILPNWRQNRQAEVTGKALFDWIDQTRATRLLLPPALCETLGGGGAPAAITDIFTGGGPVFPDVIDRLQQGRPDLRITCVYGSTEAEPIAHLHAADISQADREAMQNGQGLLAGQPVDQVRLRIVDDEIQVAGDHVNKGYLDPARDAGTKVADGGIIWHRTGDAGRLDEKGRLWLLGRTTAVARRGGQTIYPFTIETAARFWPGLRRAALAQVGDDLVLAVEGDTAHLADWRASADALGIYDVKALPALPLDRRHRSKIDYPALAKMLGVKG